MKDLSQIREKINEIDSKIIELWKDRMETCLSVAQYKAQQAKTANNNANNKPSSPTIKPAHASTNSGQIGQIIDDFSMEKAVIYSEILKPKFEEF